MALTKTYTKRVSGKDIEFENAYIQITYDSGDKTFRNAQVTIFDSIDKKHVVEQQTHYYTPNVIDNTFNFIKQGYEYLKTLPEYEDAEDC